MSVLACSRRSNYTLSVNMIAAPFNMTAFNDGYHIVHHLNSVLHWSEMPLAFMRNIDKLPNTTGTRNASLKYLSQLSSSSRRCSQ